MQASFDIARQALKSAPYVPDSVLEGEKFILLPDTAPPSLAAAVGISPSQYMHSEPIFSCKVIPVWSTADHIRGGADGREGAATSLQPARSYFDGVTGFSGTFFGSGNSTLVRYQYILLS